MKKNYFISLNILFMFWLSIVCNAQLKHTKLDLKEAPKFWVDTINFKYQQYTKNDDFLIYKQTSKKQVRNTEMPILLQMRKGRLYHFMIFTDPKARKVEMKLGLRGVGHILTDKYYPRRDDETYTEFSYVCSKDGIYLLTLVQRGTKKRMLTHIAVLQKERLKNNKEFGYK